MSTIKKTYLRYECADACAVTCDATAYSSQIISHIGTTSSGSGSVKSPPIVVCAAKSQCVAFHMRRGAPCAKIAHREPINIGTGRALNSNEITCLDTITNASSTTGDSGSNSDQSSMMEYIATGWADGSIRLFQVSPQQLQKASSSLNASDPAHNLGLVHSLLQPKTLVNDDFIVNSCGDPLVLHGHGSTPVRYVTFDRGSGGGHKSAAATRLASGGSDGTVIVWDVVAETGLFRLLGHKGAITHLSFVSPQGAYGDSSDKKFSSTKFDGLISAGLDGMVKIWDLDAQCCVQTLTGHRSEVWAADCIAIAPDKHANDDEDDAGVSHASNQPRFRLVTASSDVQLRVWGLYQPQRTVQSSLLTGGSNSDPDAAVAQDEDTNNVAVYMGSIHRQTNERSGYVKFHPNGRLLGVLAHNSKTVEVYAIRSCKDSEKRRKRRLRRRREKESVKSKKPLDAGKDTKKGILDDDDVPPSDDENDNENDASTTLLGDDMNPEQLKASDELELLGIVRSNHKIKSFVFSPNIEGAGRAARVVLALSTNALETHLVVPLHKEG
jgi:WD40 repeat protein